MTKYRYRVGYGPEIKMSVFKCFLILLLLLAKCDNIDVDYYDDNNYMYEFNESSIESIKRRFGDEENNTKSSDDVEDIKTYNSLIYNHNDTVFSKNTVSGHEIKEFKYRNTSLITTPTNIYVDSGEFSKENNISSTVIWKSDLLRDYEYMYDADKEHVLRQESVTKEDYTEKVVNYTTPFKLKDHSVQFYNLEPAVEKDVLKEIFNNSQNENVWYVPENYPCWELPLLYGELGQRRKTSKVFLIYGGYLKNVVDTNDNYTNNKSTPLPVPQSGNRWCAVQPCYGDHTLCLFRYSTMSRLCEEGYKVHVPTILDQIALVNTINSMRNQVAGGECDRYAHLPKAANMNQVTYDYDLQKISEVWLRQCLPGPAPCSALDGHFVSHLECTKYADYCCKKSREMAYECAPKMECFIPPIVGCIHEWFWSGGKHIKYADVQCGRTSVKNFNAVQLLWAKTIKVGCAFGRRKNGDVRVVCNFAPGAPFFLATKLYCGIIAHNDKIFPTIQSLDKDFLTSLGVIWNSVESKDKIIPNVKYTNSVLTHYEHAGKEKTIWGVQSLTKIYKDGWVRRMQSGVRKNGTRGMIARLVAKYTFIDENQARCDTNESMYVGGESGSLCVERGRRYRNLCYDFRDPTPGYRLVAVAAPIALFTLILYDLFSGVVRQSN